MYEWNSKNKKEANIRIRKKWQQICERIKKKPKKQNGKKKLVAVSNVAEKDFLNRERVGWHKKEEK